MKNTHSAAIVVNYNSWAFLERCLDALLNQTASFHRILVVDNASDEIPKEAVERWTKQCAIEFHFLTSNLGFAKANNIAIDLLTDCDWIALVNPDAYLDPEWHERMLQAVEAHPDAASFCSCLMQADAPTKLDGIGDNYHISGLVWRHGHGREIGFVKMNSRAVFSPCAAAAFYRRQAVVEVGAFDEDYFCYVEDVDLGFRLRLLGFESYLVPQAIALHQGSVTSGGQHSDFSLYHGHRNLVWTFVKDMPGSLFWLMLPLHLCLNVATVVWFTIQGRGNVILRAKRDAINGLAGAWAKRAWIQRNRRCSLYRIWRMLDKGLLTRK